MTVLRPYASARTPVSGEASSAKKDVQDVIRLLSRVVRGRDERSVPIETRVEDMTPVLELLVLDGYQISREILQPHINRADGPQLTQNRTKDR